MPSPSWSDAPVSAGQVALTPLQRSATSQTSPGAAGLQMAPAGFFASAGQALFAPSQNSATSQAPALTRHFAVAGLTASAGHAAEVPVQASALSHFPSALRQTLPVGLKASTGQLTEAPSHTSATSQSPEPARQIVPAEARTSAGQLGDVPSQASATSHGPAFVRQVLPRLPGGCRQRITVKLPGGPEETAPQRSSVQGLPSSSQESPTGLEPFAGQDFDVPLQVAATSQEFFGSLARHTVPAVFRRSIGQFLLDPSQTSTASQRSEAARQIVPLGFLPSRQLPRPSQKSSTSQLPEVLRHLVEVAANPPGRHSKPTSGFSS